MAEDWASVAAEVGEALANDIGGSCTIHRSTVSGADAGDPTSGAETVADYSATMFLERYDVRQIDGTRIRSEDKRVMVATTGLSIAPLITDTITIGGQEYQIVNVTPLQPDGVTVVMWEIQARA